MPIVIIAVMFTFILSLSAVALVLSVARKKSWYDRLDDRKIHTGSIPRLGGIGFAFAFIVTSLVINLFAQESYFGMQFVPVLSAMLLIFVFGVYDDFKPLPPKVKLSIQIVAALLVVIPDYTFHRLFFFDIGPLGELNWVRFPLTLLWIVGLTNAVNFIDGVDGLSGGVSALAAVTYAAIFASFANMGSVVTLCLCLTAAIAGFLVYNWPLPKAKIFMGDCGAQFLGFMLAMLPILDRGNTRSDLPLPYAAALLSIPIFDTISAVWRRLRDHRRIDSPDRAHIHHKLMNLGLSARGVDAVAYGLQILLGVLVFISVQLHGMPSIALLCLTYLIVIAFFSTIHYMNRRVTAPLGGNGLAENHGE